MVKTSLRFSRIIAGFWAVPFFVAVGMAGPQPPASLTLAQGSRLWLTGESTLHQYESTATIVNVRGNIGGSLEEAAWGGKLESFDLSIPVESFRSHSKKLDSNMYVSLKSKDFPTIDFHLTSLELAGEPTGESHPLKSSGTLTIAGKAQNITLEMTARSVPA